MLATGPPRLASAPRQDPSTSGNEAMSSFDVSKVRTRTNYFPVSHEHVTHLMLASKAVEPIEQISSNLAAGQRYTLNGARLRLDSCPICSALRYLRVGRGRVNPLLALNRF